MQQVLCHISAAVLQWHGHVSDIDQTPTPSPRVFYTQMTHSVYFNDYARRLRLKNKSVALILLKFALG